MNLTLRWGGYGIILHSAGDPHSNMQDVSYYLRHITLLWTYLGRYIV